MGVIDPYSQTWLFIESWAKAELDKLRERNDSPKLDFEKTCVLRGRIRELKELLAMRDMK